jgi:mRNA-degrading endonuclease toxin of MazEF toxin-antitoxin module
MTDEPTRPASPGPLRPTADQPLEQATAGRLRWAVVRTPLDPAVGHEQGGTRRALVVSAEPFHRARLATILPITASRSEARYPAEVAIGIGEAGQTKAGVILCHQVRTVSLDRLAGPTPDGYVTTPAIRAAVRAALAHHLGLDIPAIADGARPVRR